MNIMETKVYKFGFVVYDYLMLNFIITLFSIPVVTLVPAVVAGFRCHREKDFEIRTFIGYFKENYINLSLIGNLYLISIAVIIPNILYYFKSGENLILSALLVFIGLEFILAFLQIFNEKISNESNLIKMLKKSFLLGNIYLIQSLWIVIIMIVYAYIASFIETLVLFIFSFFLIIYSRFMRINIKNSV